VSDGGRRDAAALLAELGLVPKLTIYMAGAPGAGKSHRLLTDARGEAAAGRHVAIGWIETKGRPQLEALAQGLPRIPPRRFSVGNTTVEDFDLEAAIASPYETIVLDELAHSNPPGAPHPKRWQDALALRDAGKSVLGAFNITHLETVAPIAERIIGYPIREIVPLSFLKKADRVVALDVSPAVLESRLRSGRIVPAEDVERAAGGAFAPRTLELLRELLLRTIDDLTVPILAPSRISAALAIVTGPQDPRPFLRRVEAFADALDLVLEATCLDDADPAAFEDAVAGADAGRIPPPEGIEHGDLHQVRAAFVALPVGALALRVASRPLDRDLFVADPARNPLPPLPEGMRHPYGFTMRDRLRIGYGKLTIYLGSVAGSGKTYAMLDRAHQLKDEGVDVVGALILTHGRADTVAKAEGLEMIPRLPNGEMDLAALLERHPKIALIDELAHTNEPGSANAKRYDDVLQVLRAGIDVMTTLNVQHLEGVSDIVERLTGTKVRETLPDGILVTADEVIFIDVTPDELRQRLRQGKIYPAERVERALANFFRTENLTALRELAMREVIRSRSERHHSRPTPRILLGVAPRARDASLIERAGRFCSRIDAELRVVTVMPERTRTGDGEAIDALERAAKRAHGSFAVERAGDAVHKLVELIEDGDLLAVESLRKRSLMRSTSFAARLLRAGAPELMIFSAAAVLKIEAEE